jgi:hypothetical protein
VTRSPVLILSFNRPDTTQRVVEAVKAAKPSAVYLFSDGPRESVLADRDLVRETRQVLDQAFGNGPSIHRRYNETNNGLFAGVSGAVDWFFSEVTEGIILEDDCVPHQDFFGYCDELLERYRGDERVWCISGDNSLGLPVSGGYSYGFIRDPLIWGWATWRRAWQHFDRDFSQWPLIRKTSRERELYPDRVERKIRRGVFDSYAKGIDAWGFKWKLTVQVHNGLTAVPRVNLVSNIGWGRPDATHTTGTSLRAAHPVFPILPLHHPPSVALDRAADREFVESRGLGVKKYRWNYQLSKMLSRIRRKLGRWLSR